MGSLTASDLLFAFPIKSGLVAIQCGHNELHSGLVDVPADRHNLPSGVITIVDFFRINGEAAKSAILAISSMDKSALENRPIWNGVNMPRTPRKAIPHTNLPMKKQ